MTTSLHTSPPTPAEPEGDSQPLPQQQHQQQHETETRQAGSAKRTKCIKKNRCFFTRPYRLGVPAISQLLFSFSFLPLHLVADAAASGDDDPIELVERSQESEDHVVSNSVTSASTSSSPQPPPLGEASAEFRSTTMLLAPELVEQARQDQEALSSLMPSKEILLRFENVDKFVELVEDKPFRKKKVTLKQILFGASGCVRPGEIMALMGPSGSGKTTLLNVLGGRTTMRLSGEVTLNGERLVKSMKRRIAYVMQQDIFFDHLTVREQLTFTALLRFPRKMTRQQKTIQVQSIIDALGMSKCADSPIWLISGGERKRVNIGTELLTNPTLLLLDEPTSGLDSTTSVQLMKTLRLLALRGKTIVTSIHQPSSQVFQAFDKLLLLADGKMIYSGPPRQVNPYFAQLGYRSPPDTNPADFIMDLVNADDNPRELLHQKFLEFGIKTLDLPPRINREASSDTIITQASMWPTSYLDQLRVLMHRNAKNSKAKLFTVLNFSQSVLLAVVSGLCWFRLAETDDSIINREGFVRPAAIFFSFHFSLSQDPPSSPLRHF